MDPIQPNQGPVKWKAPQTDGEIWRISAVKLSKLPPIAPMAVSSDYELFLTIKGNVTSQQNAEVIVHLGFNRDGIVDLAYFGEKIKNDDLEYQYQNISYTGSYALFKGQINYQPIMKELFEIATKNKFSKEKLNSIIQKIIDFAPEEQQKHLKKRYLK